VCDGGLRGRPRCRCQGMWHILRQSRPESGLDCLEIDCLITDSGLDCLIIDCLITDSGLDCLINGLDCLMNPQALAHRRGAGWCV